MIKFIMAFFLFIAVPAIAECEFEFDNFIDIEWSEYDPFETSDSRIQITIQIRNTGTEQCDGYITASKGLENDPNYDRKLQGPSESLSYQLYANKNIVAARVLKMAPDLQTNKDVLNFSNLNSGNTKNKKMAVSIPVSQLVEAGTYEDTVEFYLYSGNFTNTPDPSTLQDQRSIQISALVNKYVYLDTGVGSIGNSLSIDLGEMEANKQDSFEVVVKSNSNYDVTAQSENAGSLVHTNVNLNMSSSYIFKSDNSVVDLSSGNPVNVINNESSTPASGRHHDFIVQLPASIPLLSKGDYADIIILTITEQ
jgi:spore coat protein U-like protein